MKFWDASALLPLLLEEPTSRWCRKMLGNDPEVCVWTLTSVELTSALYRRHREGALADPALAKTLSQLDRMALRWVEVDHLAQVREKAVGVLRQHSLKAADALQLASALIACDGRPTELGFACLDERLARAARVEGFDVLWPE